LQVTAGVQRSQNVVRRLPGSSNRSCLMSSPTSPAILPAPSCRAHPQADELSKIQRNSLALIRLARSFGQALRRTCSPYLGTAARASLILTKILFCDPNQRTGSAVRKAIQRPIVPSRPPVWAGRGVNPRTARDGNRGPRLLLATHWAGSQVGSVRRPIGDPLLARGNAQRVCADPGSEVGRATHMLVGRQTASRHVPR
jgi:hypothetical protein